MGFHLQQFVFTLYAMNINPLNAELNPIRHLLALVGAAILSTLAG